MFGFRKEDWFDVLIIVVSGSLAVYLIIRLMSVLYP